MKHTLILVLSTLLLTACANGVGVGIGLGTGFGGSTFGGIGLNTTIGGNKTPANDNSNTEVYGQVGVGVTTGGK